MPHLIAIVKNAENLTPAEQRVLKYLCEGCMRKEIARHVFRSVGCVSKQLESIAVKLDAHSAAEIVANAVALRMVEIHRVDGVVQRSIITWVLLAFLAVQPSLDLRNPPRLARQTGRFFTRSMTTTRGDVWT